MCLNTLSDGEVGETRDDPGIRLLERLSLSNFLDRDRVVRRQLLGMAVAPESFCQTDISFSSR